MIHVFRSLQTQDNMFNVNAAVSHCETKTMLQVNVRVSGSASFGLVIAAEGRPTDITP